MLETMKVLVELFSYAMISATCLICSIVFAKLVKCGIECIKDLMGTKEPKEKKPKEKKTEEK
jgi:hypothetical protein